MATFPNIDPLPPAPDPDSPATFNSLAYPFTAAMEVMAAQMNAFVNMLNGSAGNVGMDVLSAETVAQALATLSAVSYATQTLTGAQQNQTLTNIGARVLDAGPGWSSVSRASPAFNTTYTNTTGYPMRIVAQMTAPAGTRVFMRVSDLASDLVSKPETGTFAIGMAYVPAGGTYSVTIDAGSPSALVIYEWRKS